ncbi:YeiH family protein [Rhizobium sp. RAF56]|jgi:uncharacterized integral membrane protein (TIGR00698 family)|uniref:YeiH family protein n=1 Tax=Rhizobium sp. RAF56 TaxID=3233062 RepID=UPI003F978ACD
MSPSLSPRSVYPGLALSVGVATLASVAEYAEIGLLGGRWIEGLLLAIAIGIAVRTVWPLGVGTRIGIDFAAKRPLEIAIVLLGASISLSAIRGAGLALVGGIAVVVLISVAVSYLIGRLFGLAPKLAALIACGNSICGNSAIVAVAPVLRAGPEDIAASLAFTAVLGVLAVFLLPMLYFHGGLSVSQYGILAGMTVYAVPQVLAATAPVGLLGVQTGTLVKLVRVLMLGPITFMLGILMRNGEKLQPGIRRPAMVPWFILGFLGMMALRSLDFIPQAALLPIAHVSTILTVIAMAALGLSVDVRSIAHAGGRVIMVATLSVAMLGAISYGLIRLLNIM